ncbi:hypothetical protein Tco_0256416 [Tanacetum coccineum]
MPLDEIRVDDKLNFMEEPVEILEREFKKLKRSMIAIVKILYRVDGGDFVDNCDLSKATNPLQAKELLQIKEMADQDTPPPTITAMKIPIIKKGEYDIWSMRMRQYICHTDHNLWDIIVNGDLEDEATPSGEQSSPPVPKTAKQLAARRNQERIKSILLLAIPDEYLLKFHNVPDAKSLWAAIKSRFGGNEESKKMQKNVLKHQFENFVTASNETLDKAYDRFQKLISQLEIHGAYRMGPPTQVCVRSCPNINAPAGRPFRWLPLIANSLAVSGMVLRNQDSERQHGQQPTWVHHPWDRDFKEYQGSDESSGNGSTSSELEARLCIQRRIYLGQFTR